MVQKKRSQTGFLSLDTPVFGSGALGVNFLGVDNWTESRVVWSLWRHLSRSGDSAAQHMMHDQDVPSPNPGLGHKVIRLSCPRRQGVLGGSVRRKGLMPVSLGLQKPRPTSPVHRLPRLCADMQKECAMREKWSMTHTPPCVPVRPTSAHAHPSAPECSCGVSLKCPANCK